MDALLSAKQRNHLFNILEEISTEEIIKNYSFNEFDRKAINNHRGLKNKLGFAIQLGLLRHKGRFLTTNEKVHYKILDFLSIQLEIPKEVYFEYEAKGSTACDHINEIKRIYEYNEFSDEIKTSIKTTMKTHLFRSNDSFFITKMLMEELKKDKIILPGITILEALVNELLIENEKEIINEINKGINEQHQQQLDEMLNYNEQNNTSILTWLRKSSGKSTPEEFVEIAKKIEYIKSLELNINTDKIANHVVDKFIKLGAKYEPFSLRRFDPKKRYAILVVFLRDFLQELMDRIITIHNIKIDSLFSSIQKKQEKNIANKKNVLHEIINDYIKLGSTIIEAKANNNDLNNAIEENIPFEKLVESINNAKELANNKNLNTLEMTNDYYNTFRKYSPTLLKVLDLKSTNETSKKLISAINIIKKLNESKGIILPEDIDISFTNKKWQSVINKKTGSEKRHYFEMAVLNELRNKVRAGDISVSGSKSYKNYEDYLISKDEWEIQKLTTRLCAPLSVDEYFEQMEKKLDKLLKWYSKNYEKLDEIIGLDNKLHPAKVEKTTPEDAKELSNELYKLVPKIGLQDLLLEISKVVKLDECFPNITNEKDIQTKEDLMVLIYTIMGIGTNVGLSKISESLNKISYKQLAHTADWRISEENLYKALTRMTNAQLKEPIAALWGDGTTSSSDGMRLISIVQSLIASKNPHFGIEEGFTIYRFINDQYAAFYSIVTNTNLRDAIHVIDGLLKYAADEKIKEHYTDTAGYTDQVFALMALMGFRFAPRLRNLKDLKLYYLNENKYNNLKELVTGKINKKLIRENYDSVMRLAHSIFEGKVSSSLILSKFGSYARKNSVANALKEMGRIEKTIFILEYASDPEFRKKIQIGLNKGEEMNGMARGVLFGKKGKSWEYDLQQQLQKSSCLNVILDAIVLWNTKYLSKAWKYYKAKNPEADEKLLKHISPLNWEHINFLGKYSIDFETEYEEDNLRKLNI